LRHPQIDIFLQALRCYMQVLSVLLGDERYRVVQHSTHFDRAVQLG
jgi:hypothetical protein